MKKFIRSFISSPLEYLFFIYLYIAQFYYSYRYILRVNSTTTSPTYGHTSILEEVMKYVITVIFFILFIITIFISQKYKDKYKKIFSIKSVRIIFYTIILAILYFVGDIVIQHGISLHLLKTSVPYDYMFKFLIFIPVIFISPIIFIDKASIRYWMQFLYISMLFQFLYTLIQLGLLITIHRYPALGYPGGSVRFGGGWDDPNGVSLFYTLFLVFLVFEDKLRSSYKYIMILTTMLLIYLALSFTALILIFLFCIFLLFIKKYKQAIFTIASLIAIFLISLIIPNYFRNNFLFKYRSAGIHIDEIIKFHNFGNAYFPLIYKVFGGKVAVFMENFYKQLYHNFGIVGFILLAIPLCYLLYVYARKIWLQKKTDFFSFSAFLFIILFGIGNLGLPYFEIFPVNVFLWVMCGALIASLVTS